MVKVHRAIQIEVIAARRRPVPSVRGRIHSGPRELILRQMAEVLDGAGGIEAISCGHLRHGTCILSACGATSGTNAPLAVEEKSAPGVV